MRRLSIIYLHTQVQITPSSEARVEHLLLHIESKTYISMSLYWINNNIDLLLSILKLHYHKAYIHQLTKFRMKYKSHQIIKFVSAQGEIQFILVDIRFFIFTANLKKIYKGGLCPPALPASLTLLNSVIHPLPTTFIVASLVLHSKTFKIKDC